MVVSPRTSSAGLASSNGAANGANGGGGGGGGDEHFQWSPGQVAEILGRMDDADWTKMGAARRAGDAAQLEQLLRGAASRPASSSLSKRRMSAMPSLGGGGPARGKPMGANMVASAQQRFNGAL